MTFSGNIVTEGNSLTQGVNASGPSAYWPAVAAASLALGGGVTWHNVATSGYGTPQLIARAATTHALLTGTTKILVVWEMTNDVGSGGANRLHAAYHMMGYCATAKATTGASVICVSSIPRDDAALQWVTSAARDAELLAADALIAAQYTGFGIDAFINLRAHAVFANVAAASNLTYYAVDKLHLTDAGYSTVSDLIAPTIRSLCV